MISFAALGCGSGGGAGSGTSAVDGSFVKGPLAGAPLTAYAVDLAAAGLKGEILGTGETSAIDASIQGLSIPSNTSGHVLIEFVADSGTTDLTTGAAPILGTLVTVVNAERILAGEPVYATPLSSMAVGLAIENAGNSGAFGGDGDANLSEVELELALVTAGNQVASTFGFGLLDDMDIFTTPPLLNEDTDTAEEQTDVAAYRTANEALAAVLQSISDDTGGTSTPENVLDGLASDLGDGTINGRTDAGGISALGDAPNFSTLVVQNPAALQIPGTEILISDVDELLANELTQTGTIVDASGLLNGTISAMPGPAETVPDSDLDGERDDMDNCVAVANPDQDDLDSDMEGDACDEDDDGDGVDDADDAFPRNATETVDTDEDGTGNNADTDDDGDGVLDENDAFPLDGTETADTDEDGTGNNADTDDDGDGVLDENDVFPLDPNESTDTDNDGTGDNADTDDDADGEPDVTDNCPTTPNSNQADSDGNGIGDACDVEGGSGLVWGQGNWGTGTWQ